MIGWALVILQGNLPQGNLIYILAILLGGCVSVTLAIVIKKLVSKKLLSFAFALDCI